MSTKSPRTTPTSQIRHDPPSHRELPSQPFLELTEVYTSLVFGHPRTAKALSQKVNADIKPNLEQWWHVDGPEWLEPYLKLIAAGKVLEFAPGTSDKEKNRHQHLFAKAEKWLAAGNGPADLAYDRVGRESEKRRGVEQEMETLNGLLFDMVAAEEVRLFGKRVTRDQRDSNPCTIPLAYFARPINFNRPTNELWPKGDTGDDEFDHYPYYCYVRISRSDAVKLQERFNAAEAMVRATHRDPIKPGPEGFKGPIEAAAAALWPSGKRPSGMGKKEARTLISKHIEQKGGRAPCDRTYSRYGY